jgi:hypothetical protein
MFKRIMLALTFLAAFGTLSVAVSNQADAWGRWRRPYVSYYAPPTVTYDRGYAPYRAYYGPRVYRPYRTYYRYPGNYYRSSYYRPGVSVSVGF